MADNAIAGLEANTNINSSTEPSRDWDKDVEKLLEQHYYNRSPPVTAELNVLKNEIASIKVAINTFQITVVSQSSNFTTLVKTVRDLASSVMVLRDSLNNTIQQ